MEYAKQIVPVSKFKNSAADYADIIAETKYIVLTQNGEAKYAVVDIERFQHMEENEEALKKIQNTMALMKLLEIGEEQIDNGEYLTLEEAFDEVLREND
ncbi:MAG: type II toxin-antitoxin system Phd/YefM family antitoxin [Deferribacteraceae bacterium]|jgi:PHD/YefM family antitoxin component YafN of YafNO toxin-antitoxin module|nr:type II toxin-antitoxin system Phd/YefM family antitoxin [Deferribacteraceae bacterium]